MATPTVETPRAVRDPSSAVAYLARLLSGPVAFVIVWVCPLALPYQGHMALATFACVVVWWMAQPMPWAIAALLPLLVFPWTGVMDIAATARLYGQPIFFWIMGTVLMGHAIEKHGLAQRIALAFLALPGVGGKASRLTFTYMLMVGVVSMFISDAATVAMMMPIGMSIVRHLRTSMPGALSEQNSNFGAIITLGTLYAAVAGGTGTMMGVPHNGVAISMLERFTGRQLGFFEWMAVGIPVFLAALAIFYAALWVMARPEVDELPSGEAFLRAERAKLGPLRPDERRVLLIFATMVALFVLPTIAGLVLGDKHAAVRWMNRGLSIWVVPPLVMFLLFATPSTERGAALLTWKDAERHTPWNIMILVAAAVGMTDTLTKLGFVELVGGGVKSLGIGPTLLPYLAAVVTAVSTNIVSGVAAATLYCSIFVPAAVQVGYNPASIAILIANVAVGVAFPWAGATSATAFAGGEIDMRRMVWIGVVGTAGFAVAAATIHLVIARFL